MKTLIFVLTLTTSLSTLAIEDGNYIGTNEKTGGKCSLTFKLDGDYATYRNVEYRITEHRKDPYIDCKDYDNNEYNSCASGAQTNYQNEEDERSLYILGKTENSLSKVYFLDSDSNSTIVITCVEMNKS
jgi:hypothetical protein